MAKRTAARYEYAIVQTFRGGRTQVVSRWPLDRKDEAEEAAECLAERHAAIYGHAHTRVMKVPVTEDTK